MSHEESWEKQNAAYLDSLIGQGVDGFVEKEKTLLAQGLPKTMASDGTNWEEVFNRHSDEEEEEDLPPPPPVVTAAAASASQAKPPSKPLSVSPFLLLLLPVE